MENGERLEIKEINSKNFRLMLGVNHLTFVSIFSYFIIDCHLLPPPSAKPPPSADEQHQPHQPLISWGLSTKQKCYFQVVERSLTRKKNKVVQRSHRYNFPVET